MSGQVRLRPDQLASVEYILRRVRSLLLSEPGTGKTAVELNVAARVIDDDDGPALFVVPATLVEQTVEQASLWTPHLGEPQVHKVPTPEHPLSITSHQKLEGLLPHIKQVGLGLLVVDEAHAMATTWPKPTQLNKAVRAASRVSERVLFATGTPVDCVAALDLMGLLLAAGLMPMRQWDQLLTEVRFNRFDPAKPIPTGISQRGIEALGAMLSHSAVCTKLSDLGVALPELQTKTMRVGLSPAQLRAQELARRRYSGVTLSRRLADIGRDSDRLSVRAFLWKYRHGESHTHSLVLTERLDLVSALEGAFLAGSEPTYVLTGNTSQRDRLRILARHRADGGVLIASAVGGTGFNFQYCSLLIEVGTTWEFEKARQRRGRILRPGSPHKEITHLRIVSGSADEVHRAERRDQKSRLARQLMDYVPSPTHALTVLDPY